MMNPDEPTVALLAGGLAGKQPWSLSLLGDQPGPVPWGHALTYLVCMTMLPPPMPVTGSPVAGLIAATLHLPLKLAVLVPNGRPPPVQLLVLIT